MVDMQQMLELLPTNTSQLVSRSGYGLTHGTHITYKMVDNIQQTLERLLALQEQTMAKMDASHNEIMDSNQGKAASMTKLEEKMDNYRKKRIAILDDYHEGIMACLGKTEATDFKVNPEEMQPVTGHQEVSLKDTVVKPVRGLKTQCMGRKSTAGGRGEPKELTRGNCGSWRKLSAACRKMSHRAKVVW
jgi:hypothetical protein